MSSALSGRVGQVGLIASMRRLAYREPEWSVLLVAAASWAVLVPLLSMSSMRAVSLRSFGGAHSSMQHHRVSDSMMHPDAMPTVAIVWTSMVLAMMLPTTVPMVRYVAFASRRGRRQRSILAFGLGYLAAWMSLGVLVVVLDAFASPPAPSVVAMVVALAGVWELTEIKRRALRRCHRTYPVRFSGRPADVSAAIFGWRHGLTCLLIGGPAMVALMAAGHPLIATLAVTAIMFGQKILVRPERWRRVVAVGGILAGMLGLALP